MPSIRLGAFELRRRIGTGGMGEVWLAEHAVNGKPVAIKTVHLRNDDDQQMGHRFVAEVQAVARLSHPNIVGIHDFGVISTEAAENSLGVLQAHAPWFAMEYCAHGDLVTTRPTDWRGMHAILSSVLQALALTHANGVLHRDLKPGNVLIGSATDGGTQYKLADFGLAWSQDRNTDLNRSGQSVGTPNYMAPEQATGQLHAFGPPTDLYALGCLAWNLACGGAPFTTFGKDALALMNAQVHAHPPQFRPRYDMPRSVENWIRRLLRKDPNERYPFAAMALAELPFAGALCDLPALPIEGLPESSEPTVEVESISPLHVNQPSPSKPPSMPRLLSSMAPASARPVPPDWRGDALLAVPDPGVGRGLIGLRTVPVIGLERERDHLWRELNSVIRTGRQHLVFVRGDAGSGKTRLATWLSRFAHRRGMTQYAMASFRGQVEQGASLAASLAAHIGLDPSMNGEEALLVVASHLSRHRCDGVLARRAYLSAFDSVLSQIDLSQGSSDEERQETFVGLVAQLAQSRPMVLVLDDLVDDESALRFVELLLKQEDCPCLIVATYRPQALDGNERSQGLHQLLLDQPNSSQLDLEPLTDTQCKQFARTLLGLSDRLADRIASAAQGSPETARQTLMHLVEQDVLEVTDQGLDLLDGESVHVAETLGAAISQRTLAALDSLTAAERRFLELGTLLGERVEIDLHQRLCRRLGETSIPGLIPDLARRSIVELRRDSWSFVEPTQREMLLSKDTNSLEAHDYRAAARVLEACDRSNSLMYRWYAARNRLASGERQGAERLAQLMLTTIDEGRYQAAMKIARDYVQLVPKPAVLGSNDLYFEVRLGYNLCLYRLHRVDEGLADIDALLEDWTTLPDGLRHRALARRGSYLHPKHRQTIYEDLLLEGVAPEIEVIIRPALARRCESKGRVDDALEHYDLALRAASGLGSDSAFPILAKRSALSIAADRLDAAEQDLIACQKLSGGVAHQELWSLERRWIEWMAAKGQIQEAWERLVQHGDFEQRNAGGVHPNTQELFFLIGGLAGNQGAVRRTADEGLALGLEAFAEIFEAARVIGYGDEVPITELETLARTVNEIPARYRLAQVIYLIGAELARRGQSKLAQKTLEHAKARLSIYANKSWVERCDEALSAL
jgi:serine/threonine protein kinase/tetratricopeptide (TPR) repeat protein